MGSFTNASMAAIDEIYHQANAPDIVVLNSGGQTQVQVHAGAGQAVHTYVLANGTLTWQSSAAPNGAYVTAVIGGQSVYLEQAHLNRLSANTGNAVTGSDILYSSQSGAANDQVRMLATSVGGQDYFVAALPGMSGIYTLEMSNGGALQTVSHMADSATTYAADPYIMAGLNLNGTELIFVASQSEGGVSVYAMNSQGQLALRDSAGADDGIGINTPTTMLVVETGGTPMLLLGAAGTDTITVFGVGASGNLTLLDQERDSLDTRFAGISVMESITIDDRIYVVAGGNDDGLTLFQLLPNGQLMALDVIADTATIGLNNVNGLTLEVINGDLHAFVSSETEPGITDLTIDTASSGSVYTGTSGANTLTGTALNDLLFGDGGNDTLDGGAGQDMLMDGAGQDTMTGGAGADLFILSADDSIDTILDFDITQDRIDLSAWAMLYSVGQLSITELSDGAMITYGNESLRLYSSDQSPLNFDTFILNDLLGLFRPAQPDDQPKNLVGTPDADTLVGSMVNDTINGVAGADILQGKDGQDTLLGGDGNDSLYGGKHNDNMNGGADSDLLDGEDGADTLLGEGGHDTLLGGLGDDSLLGGTGADSLEGQAGDDTLKGDSSTD
ncbi:MAG TPA: calcium-binding protein, partial [Aliiroseovarius sp.]|nr:calcium-binding protein [Aliiroseovarius sp.]